MTESEADLGLAFGSVGTAPKPQRDVVIAMELAWGLIANVSEGEWTRQPQEWQDAAVRWRDEHWHPFLDSVLGGRPAPVSSEETP